MEENHPLRVAIREYMEQIGDRDLSLGPQKDTSSIRHRGLLKYLAFRKDLPMHNGISEDYSALVEALDAECPPVSE